LSAACAKIAQKIFPKRLSTIENKRIDEKKVNPKWTSLKD